MSRAATKSPAPSRNPHTPLLIIDEEARRGREHRGPRGSGAEKQPVPPLPPLKAAGDRGQEEHDRQPDRGQQEKDVRAPAAVLRDEIRDRQHPVESRQEGRRGQEHPLVRRGVLQPADSQHERSHGEEHGRRVIVQEEGQEKRETAVREPDDPPEQEQHDPGREEEQHPSQELHCQEKLLRHAIRASMEEARGRRKTRAQRSEERGPSWGDTIKAGAAAARPPAQIVSAASCAMARPRLHDLPPAIAHRGTI